MFGSSFLPSFTSSQVKPIIRTTATGLRPVESNPSHITLCQLLRIQQNASQLEIKSAYPSLAKQYHPAAAAAASSSSDIDGAGFIQIHNAYVILSDPRAKADYDKSTGAISAYSASNTSRYRPTKTWETDQCW